MASGLATDFDLDLVIFFVVGGACSSSASSATFFKPERLILLLLGFGVFADDLRDADLERGIGASDSSPPSVVLAGITTSWCFVREVDREGGLGLDFEEGFVDCDATREGGFVL